MKRDSTWTLGFHVQKKYLGKPEASPAVRKGMRVATPWLDLRAKRSTDSLLGRGFNNNLLQIMTEYLRLDTHAEVRREGSIQVRKFPSNSPERMPHEAAQRWRERRIPNDWIEERTALQRGGGEDRLREGPRAAALTGWPDF